MIELRQVGIETVAGWIRDRNAVAFSRWGDGEWSAILGREGHNCDGQEYTPELRQALTDVLCQQPRHGVHLAMQPLALRRFGPQIERWLDSRSLDLCWYDSSVLHKASIRGELDPVIEALRERRRTIVLDSGESGGWSPETILVGPERLERIGAMGIPVHYHVVVPDENAFDELEETIGHVDAELDWIHWRETNSWRPVVAVSAGMGGKVLIHRMHAKYPECAFIDFGSVWEPYVNHSNRSYHQAVIDRLQQGVVT